MSRAEDPSETVLTILRRAAEGDERCRSLFCARYLPLVRAYLAARWRGTVWAGHLEDGVQDVFLECLRQDGVLESFVPPGSGGFRAYLLAATRNVARRLERTQARRSAREQVGHPDLSRTVAAEESLSRVFDREWARRIMQQAREELHARAQREGDAALRRFQILCLRFEEGLPLREIAARWQEDPSALHRAYRKARSEFHAALREVVAYHSPGSPGEIEQECTPLLGLLGS